MIDFLIQRFWLNGKNPRPHEQDIWVKVLQSPARAMLHLIAGWAGRSKDEFVFRLAHLLICGHLTLNGTDKRPFGEVHQNLTKEKGQVKWILCLFKVTQFGPHTHWQLILLFTCGISYDYFVLRPGNWTSFKKVVRMISYFQSMWVCTLNIWLLH